MWDLNIPPPRSARTWRVMSCRTDASRTQKGERPRSVDWHPETRKWNHFLFVFPLHRMTFCADPAILANQSYACIDNLTGNSNWSTGSHVTQVPHYRQTPGWYSHQCDSVQWTPSIVCMGIIGTRTESKRSERTQPQKGSGSNCLWWKLWTDSQLPKSLRAPAQQQENI